jgi:chromosome segregation ATPase
MADIDVQRKTGPGIWPWILGLVVLALLIWAIAAMTGRDDRPTAMVTDTPTAAEPAATTAPAALPAAAEEYMRDCHVAEGTRTEGMGLDHDYTVNCLEQLANSLESLAQQGPAAPNVDQHTQTIRERARQIRESPETSLQHANWTREGAQAGASAFEALHQAHHAGNQQVQSAVAQVRQAAEQIDPAEQHLEQLTDVRSYFRNAGDALNQMAQRQPR